jgi:acetyl-CoA C-acetyltransferase
MGSLVDTLSGSLAAKKIYLSAATRTPIGRFGGSLRQFSAPQLATLTLKEAMRRVPSRQQPDWVILGHARQAGAGPNPARQVAIFSGLSAQTPAMTVNLACASGLMAVITAVEKIATGRAKSIWAGGTESMSNTPYLLPQIRWGMNQKRGGRGQGLQILDAMVQDGFHCPMADMLMGETVEKFLAQELHITRAEQDYFAFESQKKAQIAWQSGTFSAETFEIPLESDLPSAFVFKEDEHRKDPFTLASLEALAKLPPVFDSKQGSITAGNSSGITDGAAIIHVSSERDEATLAEIIDYEVIALDPKTMGLGPVDAIRTLLNRQKLNFSQIHSVEINEAFAAQVLACQKKLNIPPEKLNPRGGAIALGHPIGATGARILTTLLHTLKEVPGALGIASLCVSGGHGVAILVRSI